MTFTFNKPFAPDTDTDEQDTRIIRQVLNRHGYYTPNEKTGITGIPDATVFAGLKQFQADKGLPVTGKMKPGDGTVKALNEADSTRPEGKYIWRTAGDEKVREEHAQLESMIRDWRETPFPGEEKNCRCWAERKKRTEFIKQAVTSVVDDAFTWDWIDFFHHFWVGEGKEVSLEEIGCLLIVINYSKAEIFPKLEQQIIALASEIIEGDLSYETKNSYDFGSVILPVGSAVVRSSTIGEVKQDGEYLLVNANVHYEFEDVFTDVMSVRQGILGTSSKDHPKFKDYEWTEIKGTPYKIIGEWETKLTAVIQQKK